MFFFTWSRDNIENQRRTPLQMSDRSDILTSERLDVRTFGYPDAMPSSALVSGRPDVGSRDVRTSGSSDDLQQKAYQIFLRNKNSASNRKTLVLEELQLFEHHVQFCLERRPEMLLFSDLRDPWGRVKQLIFDLFFDF